MSGLVKAKKYDWKDSNLALFGSDTEKQVKKESAESEPAWENAGQEVGIQIWRIVKFKVAHWPKEDYGKFYNGDSYIILNTYTEGDSEELLYDVHFWIGQQSTQDEYGTAAYKTVELDTLLDDKPIQHREVQNNESSLFKSYFDTISLLSGGEDTGFRHVTPEEYTPRLLHFCGTRGRVEVSEVPLSKASINSSDVFILDLGLTIYQWNGESCNKDEKFKAVQYLQTLKSERGGKPKVESIEEREIEPTHEFYASLTEEADGDDTDGASYTAENTQTELHRLSDESGALTFTLSKEGDVTRDDLDSKDVFILDVKSELFVWIGSDTSAGERRNAMGYAHSFLMKTDHPLVSVTCVPEDGRTVQGFENALAA